MKDAGNFYLNRAAVLVNEGDMIPCSKALAVEFGVNGALFLQQLHFRIRGTRKAKSIQEGKYWYFCTLEEWVQEDFPFWCQRTIQRIIDKLKEDGILIVGNFNKMSRDRTHWYTIDYARMWKIESTRERKQVPSGQSVHIPSGQSVQTTCGQKVQTITLRKNTTDPEKTQPPPSAPTATSAMDFAITVKKDATADHHNKLVRKFERIESIPTVPDLQAYWKTLLTMYDYHQNLTFGKQELGNMRTLIKEVTGAGVKAHNFLEYCVQNWRTLRAKITWENKEKSRLGETPSFRTIFFCRHDILEVMRQNGGAKKEEKKTHTYTRAEDLPAMHPARREQMADMIRKLGSVTI
jgi:hypothetical protein